MKCLLLTLALVCAIQATCAAPTDEVDCAKYDAIVEDQGPAQGLSFSVDKYTRPTNMEELGKRCKEMDEALKTLKRYNQKCNTALTQQVVSAIFKSRQTYNDALCKGTPEDSQKRLDTVKCLQDNVLSQIKAAEEKATLVAQVLYQADIKDEKERLKRSCCNVIQAKEDLTKAIKPACEKHVPVFQDYIDSYTSESMSIICPNVDKMVKDGECTKLSPLSTEGVKGVYTFFLTPLIKVVKTLDH